MLMNDQSNFLRENNARHLWHPMASPAEMQANPPKVIVSAEGVTLTDLDGHRSLDAVGGLWNVNLGYSVDAIKEAAYRQMGELPYYSSFRGTTNPPVIELSYRLREFFSPEGMVRSFFTSGGSDSVETALRLARQYHSLRGEPGRTKFFSLKKGYHGTHFGGASVNGNANFRASYEPLLAGCFHMPAPYPYRNPFNETDPARLADLCASAIEDEINFQGPKTIAAFIMEPVLGAGGVIPPHPSFMPKIREICDRYGILLIADEVITAFGRTGAWTGSRLWSTKPDLLCTAKAITNGYFPFGAVMLSEKVAEPFEAKAGPHSFIGHGYTYSGHPVGAAAALVCLEQMQAMNVAANAAVRGDELLAGLHNLSSKYQVVGDVRGKGLMAALEIVTDRATKAPAGPEMMSGILEAAYEKGVMIRVAGPNIILSPPLVLSSEDIGMILAALDSAFQAVA